LIVPLLQQKGVLPVTFRFYEHFSPSEVGHPTGQPFSIDFRLSQKQSSGRFQFPIAASRSLSHSLTITAAKIVPSKDTKQKRFFEASKKIEHTQTTLINAIYVDFSKTTSALNMPNIVRRPA